MLRNSRSLAARGVNRSSPPCDGTICNESLRTILFGKNKTNPVPDDLRSKTPRRERLWICGANNQRHRFRRKSYHDIGDNSEFARFALFHELGHTGYTGIAFHGPRVSDIFQILIFYPCVLGLCMLDPRVIASIAGLIVYQSFTWITRQRRIRSEIAADTYALAMLSKNGYPAAQLATIADGFTERRKSSAKLAPISVARRMLPARVGWCLSIL